MEDIMVDNPLGLPRDQNNQAHQLQLRRPDGMDAARRTALCTPVLAYLATTNQGIVYFNGLHQIDQLAAILLADEEGSHT